MSEQLLQRDARAVWHPYTQHQTAGPLLPVASGSGAYLYDTGGRAYLDMIASWWVNLHGHGVEPIAEAIGRQARRLDHVHFAGVTHEPAVHLCEKLLALTGLDGRVFLSDNGSTAVEVALKAAHQYWKNKGQRRKRVLVFEGGYHGDTVGAMALGRSSGFFGAFEELLFDVERIPVPQVWMGHSAGGEERSVLAHLELTLERIGEEISALVVEPLVQGASGMRFHSEAFLEGVCELVQARGIPVIADEVMTGFYRLGTLFAFQKTRVRPDAICLSKGITGGVLPLGATVFRRAVFEAFLGSDFSQALAHGHSYTANPVVCAAALANLGLLEAPGFGERVAQLERTFRVGLERLAGGGLIERPRVRGGVCAFEIGGGKSGYGAAEGRSLAAFAQERGVLIRPLGSTVYLIPPYCVTLGEVERVFGVMEEWLAEFARGGRR
jgi:adenosylmethionine-8-amino-7-oxononanoate aminotransferase